MASDQDRHSARLAALRSTYENAFALYADAPRRTPEKDAARIEMFRAEKNYNDGLESALGANDDQLAKLEEDIKGLNETATELRKQNAAFTERVRKISDAIDKGLDLLSRAVEAVT